MNKIGIIIEREWRERVMKKSFIITTVAVPLLMIALMALPSLIMLMGEPGKMRIGVIDSSGVIASRLENRGNTTFVEMPSKPADMKSDNDYDAYLIIDPDIIEDPSGVSLYSHSATSLELDNEISAQLSDIIEQERLESMEMGNLREILKEVEPNVVLHTYRLDENGEAGSTSSLVSHVLGMGSSLVLYMFLMLYGQMVLSSIIEEKSNRVLDLMVTTVKPTELMMGKILGVGLVALTQILVWIVLVFSAATVLMPVLFGTEMMAGGEAATAGVDAAANGADVEMLQALAMFSNSGLMLQLVVAIIAFMLGGFLLYSAIYAAIGSAVDNVQDASQLTSLAVVPLIMGFIFSNAAATDPGSTMSQWLSYVPFTSPMVMMVRLPFGVTWWELALSIAILYATIVVMVWLAGRVYRVGIFMHGKKPTMKQLYQWIRLN